jgi:Ca-activated chloride channel homolog
MKRQTGLKGFTTVSLLLCILLLLLAGCSAAPRVTEPPVSPAPSPGSSGSVGRVNTTPTVTPGVPSQPLPEPAPSITVSGTRDSEKLGLAVGGAKDINNFRDNLDQGYLPLVSDVTVEGLFYDYYFDTGDPGPSAKLFSPAYSQAVSRDPFSGETEYYLAVGLNSGLRTSDFERQNLNLVVVLDVSGSMGSAFDRYYYDGTGQRAEVPLFEREQTKIAVAREAVLALIDQLDEDDRLGIVTFNDRARTLRPLAYVDGRNLAAARDTVRTLGAGGGTNLAAGMDLATDLFDEYLTYSPDDYENRVIFITDAMPNLGDTSRYGLLGMAERNADDRLHSTFIGVGVDFNTQLVNYITGIRGSNYYAVHSPSEFRRRLDAEFDYMVTPLVFDLELRVESAGWEIETVYGSPEADISTGSLMRVNTLFPSESSGGETRGGLILLKLRRTGRANAVRLTARYEDRFGRRDSVTREIWLERTRPEQFDNDGVRKGVLLARYATLLQLWIQDERQHMHLSYPWEPTWERGDGIGLPPRTGNSDWERQSLPLTVSREYRARFSEFADYCEVEMRAIGDNDLRRELAILETLAASGYRD